VKTRPGFESVLVIAIGLIGLAACARPAPGITPTAIRSTETAMPALDLAGVFSSRRLQPPMATSVEMSDIPHPSFAELPEPGFFISAVYASGAEFAGRVSLFMYGHSADLDAAWPLLLDLIVTPNEVPGIGELAAVDHSDMAFIRCMALVHIKLVNSDPVELRTFAEILDAQLVPLICNN
jgi:hypothetical protein